VNIPKSCPHCAKALLGREIPVEERANFDGQTHYCRLIAVEVDDKPKYWRCWNCEVNWEINKAKPVYWWDCD